MKRFRNPLSWASLTVGLTLELFLVTGLANGYRNPGHEFGRWGVRLGHDAAEAVSWLAVVFVGLAFIAFWAALRVWVMLGIIVAAVLIEFLWGRELPPPQDRWGYGLAFVLGALVMFVNAVLKKGFVDKAREHFGRLWGN